MRRFILFLFLVLPINAFAENIKVGIILPLTGALAEYGVASRNGIELARKNSPDLFKAIDFVYEDSQYDPKIAISAYRKLRTDPLVKVIYNWGSNPSAPLVPIAESEKFPLFVADFSSITYKGIKNVIAFAPTSNQLGDKLNTWLKNKNYKQIAILSVENLYVNGIIDGLSESLSADQKIVFHEKVLATDNDFKSYLGKLKQKKYDVLGVLLYAGQIQNLYRNLKTNNISKPTFGSDFMESRAEIKGSGELIEGAVYPHLKISDDYYKMYRNAYGDDSQVTSSGTAYDFAMILAKLYQQDQKFYEHYLSLLPSLSSYVGVMGPYKYEETETKGKRVYPPIYLKAVKNGFYEVIE